ncbi:MAG TPA: hypothetical protein HA257_07990, partial [Candidatus Methanoperedenaceae archaeon]|nr:hypothetical protein [Candidatus Methanoperedenaceae archaeon]
YYILIATRYIVRWSLVMRKRLFLLSVLIIMMSAPVIAPNGGGNGGVGAHLWLFPDGGTYVASSLDDWLNESWTIGFGPFDLNVSNQDKEETVNELYIITAINKATGITVELNGMELSNWIAADGSKPSVPTNPPYEYPPHGIYQTGTYYNITRFSVNLQPKSNITLQVFTDGPSGAKVHFDAVGANYSNAPILFVPPSHDATSYGNGNHSVPEFPVIALPVAMLLGIIFYILWKRGKV